MRLVTGQETTGKCVSQQLAPCCCLWPLALSHALQWHTRQVGKWSTTASWCAEKQAWPADLQSAHHTFLVSLGQHQQVLSQQNDHTPCFWHQHCCVVAPQLLAEPHWIKNWIDFLDSGRPHHPLLFSLKPSFSTQFLCRSLCLAVQQLQVDSSCGGHPVSLFISAHSAAQIQARELNLNFFRDGLLALAHRQWTTEMLQNTCSLLRRGGCRVTGGLEIGGIPHRVPEALFLSDFVSHAQDS